VTLGEPRMDMNSFGDTWDASWADDGNIYIQSDDSKGFGDQPGRNLQFHVLRGEGPDGLVGQTVNTMDEYGPMASRGPDGKMWKACGNTCIDGMTWTPLKFLVVALAGLMNRRQQDAIAYLTGGGPVRWTPEPTWRGRGHYDWGP
jgi:hypothetical protein